MKDVKETLQEIQKVAFPSDTNSSIMIGDIVRWKYEIKSDPHYGSLYMVLGLNSEKEGIVIVSVLGFPNLIREFHISQLRSI